MAGDSTKLDKKPSYVSVHLLSDTAPIEFHDVINSYEKDGIYNVLRKTEDGGFPVHRYVPEGIFRVVETRAWNPSDSRLKGETLEDTVADVFLKTTRQPIRHINVINSISMPSFYCLVEAGTPESKTDNYILYPRSNIREVIDHFEHG